ncbi:hypothetical protein [Actomonas aquatica]|uniref:DUF429 domain-containing protein n=1 Tax=Actomonas aquatica TaxID=2866162 RepID=A0ABZ1C2Y0_9BACT|nr:hypothetical protein [Opitutus sp. WL0086]WRQ85715.1 hypothetical protein K1X11_012955 [Opitutus sp. WL0086]
MNQFDRYIGIDYSGAKTPASSLPGIRVYYADQRGDEPFEIDPPPSPRKYWTRRGLAAWLQQELAVGPPILVGIDHGFSFPLPYFQRHHLPPDWHDFLRDFRDHWPTHLDDIYVDHVREGVVGNAKARQGDSHWRRLTEVRSGAAKSVFHFDVQGSVAKSTHSGLPWLLHLVETVGHCVHFWPFDGWQPPEGKSVIAEIYPRLWHEGEDMEGRTPDQHDAYLAASWMQEIDLYGEMNEWFNPPLGAHDREIADLEGWILGLR